MDEKYQALVEAFLATQDLEGYSPGTRAGLAQVLTENLKATVREFSKNLSAEADRIMDRNNPN